MNQGEGQEETPYLAPPPGESEFLNRSQNAINVLAPSETLENLEIDHREAKRESPSQTSTSGKSEFFKRALEGNRLVALRKQLRSDNNLEDSLLLSDSSFDTPPWRASKPRSLKIKPSVKVSNLKKHTNTPNTSLKFKRGGWCPNRNCRCHLGKNALRSVEDNSPSTSKEAAKWREQAAKPISNSGNTCRGIVDLTKNKAAGQEQEKSLSKASSTISGRTFAKEIVKLQKKEQAKERATQMARSTGRDSGSDIISDMISILNGDMDRYLNRDVGRDVGRDMGWDMGRDVGRDMGSDMGRDLARDMARDMTGDMTGDIAGDMGNDVGNHMTGTDLVPSSGEITDKETGKEIGQDTVQHSVRDIGTDMEMDIDEYMRKDIGTDMNDSIGMTIREPVGDDKGNIKEMGTPMDIDLDIQDSDTTFNSSCIPRVFKSEMERSARIKSLLDLEVTPSEVQAVLRYRSQKERNN